MAFSRPYRTVRSGLVAKKFRTKEQETYVMDEATDSEQDGGSIRFHVSTVKLLPVQDIQSSLAMLMDFKAAYGRLSRLI